MPQGSPGGPAVEGGVGWGWGPGTGTSVPGGTRGAAGTPGPLSGCPAPAPGRCTCPKPALAPGAPERGDTGLACPPARSSLLPMFPDGEEDCKPGAWGPAAAPGLQVPKAFWLQLPCL